MAALQDLTTPLIPDHYYHIFNRGNGGQWIFYQERNYGYFLEKYKKYMLDYWDTYAYCLLPNHFHLMIKVKSEAVIIEAAKKDFTKVSKQFLKQFRPQLNNGEVAPDLLNFQNLVNLTPVQYPKLFKAKSLAIFQEKLVQWVVSERFRRFLLSYAKSINVQENRKGSLFQKLFRRKPITNAAYLNQLVLYIHRNPIHHGQVSKVSDWAWTSYDTISTKCITSLKKVAVLDWFNGVEGFIRQHKKYINDWLDGENWIIEED